MAMRGVVRSSLIVTLIGLLAALTTPVRGQVAENKTFTLDVTDELFAGDANADIIITITNTSDNQNLGSANVTVPDPFVVVAAPADTDATTTAVLELRELAIAPGGSRSFVVTVDVKTCTPATSGPFQAVAKQSNTFLGTGNHFFLDSTNSDLTVGIVGTCDLAFVAQPGDAERGATITSVDYDPTGAPITVRVVDAGGTETATHSTATVGLLAANPDVQAPLFGGTTSATAVEGLATFAPGPTLAPSAFDYTLAASADFDHDGATDATVISAPLDIVDDQVDCPAGQPCAAPATATRNGQQATAAFGPGPTSTSLVVSLGAADVPDFTCDGVPESRATAQYFFVGGDAGTRQGTLSLAIPNASQPVNAYEVCWAASYPFDTDGGGRSSEQGTTPDGAKALNVGVLPDCARRGTPARPCVSDRTLNQPDSTVTIVIEADGRDPWARS